jgi:hypothetical protein
MTVKVLVKNLINLSRFVGSLAKERLITAKPDRRDQRH